MGFPLFMEQYMAEGSPYLRALYYNSTKRLCGLDRSEVMALLQEAVQIARSGFSIPVPRGANLSPEGRLFQQLCDDGCDDLLMSMNPDSANEHNFPGICEWDAWAEYVVYEQGAWSTSGWKGERCPVDRALLRQLRRQAGKSLPNLTAGLALCSDNRALG